MIVFVNGGLVYNYMRSIENVTSVVDVEESPRLSKIGAGSTKDITKNYLDILEELFAEKEITKQEYSELKQKYEYNLQRYSHSS